MNTSGSQYIAGTMDGKQHGTHHAFMQGEYAIERCAKLSGWSNAKEMLDEMGLTNEQAASLWFEVGENEVPLPHEVPCTVRRINVVVYHAYYTNIVTVSAKVFGETVGFITHKAWQHL